MYWAFFPHRRVSYYNDPPVVVAVAVLVEVVLMQDIGRLDLGDISNLAEPSSLLSVPLAKPCTVYARAPGKVSGSQKRSTYCTGQELVAIVFYPLSHHVLLGGERRGNPPYHLSCLPDRSVPKKVGCASSSLSPSQIP